MPFQIDTLILSGVSISASPGFLYINGQSTPAGNGDGVNLSGALAATGVALSARDLTTSGALAAQLTATGATLFNNDLNTSGYANHKAQLAVSFYAAAALTWTNQPAAPAFLNANAGYGMFADLTQYTGINLCVNKLGVAAAATGAMWVGYLGNYSQTAANYLPTTNPRMWLQTNVLNTMITSGFVPLAPGARSGVYLALLSSGGSAAVSPVFGNITAFFV